MKRFYLRFIVLLAMLVSVSACKNNSSQVQLCATEPYPSDLSAQELLEASSSDDVWNFVTQPDLQPMKVDVLTYEEGLAGGMLFVGPYNLGTVTGQTGSLILDNAGSPIWFRPLPSAYLQNLNFKTQEYQGKPVLTFWQGTLAIPPTYTNLPAGISEPGSCYYILDNRYRVLKTLVPQRDYTADEHEFILTSRGTALFTSIKSLAMDLTPYGGPQNGSIVDCAIQEVNLETGALEFFWSFLDHVDPADSELAASSALSSDNVWDAFHCNSIEEASNGNLLVSARSMWAIYNIQKESGEILWQLGGVESDFSFGANAQFFWQHDARFISDTKISLFDDGCCGTNPIPEQESRGLILNLDFTLMQASVDRAYYHDPALFSNSQGNLQNLSNGNKFLGWGSSPYYSEYASAGNSQGSGSDNLLYDVLMPGGNISYRAYRMEWVGSPDTPPDIALRSSNGQTIVYASWNGSTETAAWQLLAGSTEKTLRIVVAQTPRTGFETNIAVNVPGPFFQVKALDASGNILGVSEMVQRL